MPYSAINDIQSTLNHEHGMFKLVKSCTGDGDDSLSPEQGGCLEQRTASRSRFGFSRRTLNC
jgi:hypothetical protein